MRFVMQRAGWVVAGVLALALIAALAGVVRSGPLDPPGPPGSTQPQVEPRTPISSLPYAINAPGSYFLTKNLSGAAGIAIAADGVDIDLNGFTLDGAGGDDGITAGGAVLANVTVRNGTIQNWTDDGIDLESSLNVRVSGVRAYMNAGSGIEIGSGIVEDCVVTGAVGTVGVRAQSAATISNCVVQGYGTGLALNGGGVIRDSVSSAAELTGVFATGGATVTNTTVSGVGGGAGPNNGMTIWGQTLVKDNVITNIGNSPGVDSGISVSGPSNVITGNAISFVEYGVNMQNGTKTSMYENAFKNVTTYLYGDAADSDEIGPARPYADGGAWDQRLSAVAADACNSERFRCVMNNEAVLDRETGLVWQRSPSSPGLWDWFSAFQVCLHDDTGARGGWRLPTAEEIMSLWMGGQSPPLPPAGHPFTNVDSLYGVYWTATSAPWLYPETAYAWNAGTLSSMDKNAQHNFWCVRGGHGLDGTPAGTP